jgi:hypothetical protein
MMFHDFSLIKPLHLDPDTLEPNIMTAAMRAGLQILAALSTFNNPAASALCYPYDARFCAGAPPPLPTPCPGCVAPPPR